MNRNPIIPFLLIAVFGIGLIFFLSVKGIGDSKDMAKGVKGGEKTTETAAFDPKKHYETTCISCHGQNYEGGVGPALKGVGKRLTKDQIKDRVVNGGGGMPSGLVAEENADAMADYLMKLK
jgi:cytochrome c550